MSLALKSIEKLRAASVARNRVIVTPEVEVATSGSGLRQAQRACVKRNERDFRLLAGVTRAPCVLDWHRTGAQPRSWLTIGASTEEAVVSACYAGPGRHCACVRLTGAGCREPGAERRVTLGTAFSTADAKATLAKLLAGDYKGDITETG